jgi:beta-glucosidase
MNSNERLPFQNEHLPLEERVDDLVARFTLDEKINMMCQYQPEIPRLGVGKYKHGTEGAHGIAWLGEATVFPQNVGLACTWNPDLMREIGSAIGDEARVYYQKDPAINGLTIWAPTVDMERDPRWGRNEESYGEDPYLTGRLSTGMVRGMQGEDPFYFKTVATLKHFLGNNNEMDRGECSASIDPRNMREYYLKAFEPAFREGGAHSMMTAYNSVNGVPCNLNPDVNRIVKNEWGMKGFVVSDAGDVLGTVNEHKYYASYAEAAAQSIKSGIDSITDDQEISLRAIRDALELGLLIEEDLDQALKNTFRVRIRLGEFDSAHNPYTHVPESKLCAPEHGALSLRAARESIVLLKNEGILPLNKQKLSKIAVIGTLADELHTDWYSGTPPYRIKPLQGIEEKMNGQGVIFHNGCDRIRLRSAKTGMYIGLSMADNYTLLANRSDAAQAEIFDYMDWGWGSVTLKSSLNGKFVTAGEESLTATSEEARGWFVKEVFTFECCEHGQTVLKSWNGKPVTINEHLNLSADEYAEPNQADQFIIEVVEHGINKAIEAAKTSENAIVFVGNSPFINGKECVDRPDINLPPAQEALIRAVAEVNPNTIVVIIGSYPFAVNWVDQHVPAILYSSHAGQELGHAIADVLFGDYHPAGRLNMTWYNSAAQLPDILDYDIIKGKRTYQYFEGDVLYPFGHGLTYTNFDYGNIQLSVLKIGVDEEMAISILVENRGSKASDEVVQMYVRANHSRVKRPLKTLKGFKRVHLMAGQSMTVSFVLPAGELAFWDVTRDRYCIEKGEYTVMIGRSSDNILAEAAFFIEGETIPPRQISEAVRAVNYDDYEDVFLDQCSEGDTSIRNRNQAGWIAFHDVDLGTRSTKFEARVSNAGQAAVIEIHLDSPDGILTGICTVPPTGGWQAWTTVCAELSGVDGNRSVYLAFKGNVQLSWFRVYEA